MEVKVTSKAKSRILEANKNTWDPSQSSVSLNSKIREVLS